MGKRLFIVLDGMDGSGKSLMKDETTADKLLNEVSNYDKT